ncbi:hypothetical protein A5686_21985 [Mycobacterium sp. E2479]|nr:hypothetical protein A5686_21985 [Mycobacterium sp. E2479]
MQPAERIEALTRLAGVYKERPADMAALISAEIGARITFAKMAQVRLPLIMIAAFCGMAANYQRQQERVRGYIEEGSSEGARLVTGGSEMPDGLETGWYVRPTLFSDATNGMRIAREEIFGPVLTVISYRDEDEAVRIANDSEYGLAGSVFTADVERGYGVAARVRSGTFGRQRGLHHGSGGTFRRGQGQWVRPGPRYRRHRQLYGEPIHFGRGNQLTPRRKFRRRSR